MEQKRTTLRAKVLLAILSPIVFLGLLECILRLSGTGHKTTFTVKKEFGEAEYYVPNPHFTKPWFPGQNPRLPYPFGIPVVKPENSLRVLVLGASAAQGDPKPEFGFSRMLDRMLSGQFEDRKVEVFNLGITAINSHVVKEIARDAVKFHADYWVVYLGNNEVIGPYGPANPGIQNKGLQSILLKSKTGQALAKLLKGTKKPMGWQGMEAYLTPIDWESLELEAVYENFGKNLNEIIQFGEESGAKVLLSTVAVNLRNCSPLNPEGDAFDAWTKKEFGKARDYDTYRFRADSRINLTIKEIANATNSELIDAAQNFGIRESASDGSLFLDHVHFTTHGNNVLALMLGEKIMAIEKKDIVPPTVNPTIGFSSFDHLGILKIMRGRLSRPPFLKQQPDGLTPKAVSKMIESLEIKAAADLQNIEKVYLTAIDAHPHDPILRLNYATFLLSFNQAEVAKAQSQKAIQLSPWNPTAHYNLALSNAGTGSPISARENLVKALELSPNYSRAHALMGSLLSKTDPPKALYHFEESIRIEPDDPQALVSYADYLLNHSKQKKEDLAKAYDLSLHACKVTKFANPQAYLLFSSSAKKSDRNKEAISILEQGIDESSNRDQKDTLHKVIESLK